MSTKDRKIREKELRKETIIDAAEIVFNRKGYEKTTIEDIAKQAELAKGTLYLYFKSKEEIFGGIILRGLEKIAHLYETELKKATTGIDKFKMIGNVYKKFCETFPEYLQAMASYQSPEFQNFVHERGPVIKEIERRKKENLEGLTQILKLGIKDGTIDKTIDPEKTAQITMVTTALFVVSPKKQNDKNCPSTEELLNYYFELLARAIQAN